jgi:predicted dehydrogenase
MTRASSPVTRWAIIGAGRITASTVPDLLAVDGFEVRSIVTRTPGAGDELAAASGAAVTSTSLDEVLGDPLVDAVYIATPFMSHAPIARQCLRAGKHVVIEKPIATSAADTEELFAIAAAEGRFLMEGMWMKFNAVYERITDLIAAGAIGEPRSVRAGFGFPRPNDGSGRWDVTRSGSTLLDQGIYLATLDHMLFGMPDQLSGEATVRDDGLDLAGHFTLEHAGGQFTHGAYSMVDFVDPSASISGTEGWIAVPGMFWAAQAVRIHRGDWDGMFVTPQQIELPWEGFGYRPMFTTVRDALRDGLLQHPRHDERATVEVIRTLERIRSVST